MSESNIEIDEAVRRAFGRPAGSGVSAVEQFKRAGFSQEDAELGAQLLESGKFFGLEDVATTMRLNDDCRLRNPFVTSARIREAAAALALKEGS